MRVIEIRKHGASDQAFGIAERPTPKYNDDDVLIKVKTFGINFADVLARLGVYPDAPPLPSVIGYEVAGKVEAVGSKVTSLKPGDHVLAMTRFGGYAEKVVTPAYGVMKIPGDISAVEAAALPVNGLTAYHCLYEMVKVREGDRVLIHAAAGGVGNIAVQLAKHLGAEVFGTCGSDEKVEHLKKMGVHHAINYREKDYEKEIREITNGEGIDIILDSLAGPNIRKELRLLRAAGRLIVFGVAAVMGSRGRNIPKLLWAYLRAKRFMALNLLMDSKAVIGVNALRISEQRPDLAAAEMKEFFNLYQQGVVKPVISKTFHFDEIAKAHDFLESRQSIGKIIVTTD
ncbi:zinc-binding dehydrogenase [Bdellovibrionota bacterium]